MGWTNSILNGIGGFTKIAANGQGDLQKALNRSVMSQMQLVGDIAVNNGVASFANAIKVMAKYKPFKDANVSFSDFNARNDARRAARYGFPVSQLPQLDLTQNEPSALWTYDRPVTISNGSAVVNSPLRAEDFIKDTTTPDAGYDPGACAPLAVMVGQLTYDSWSQVLVFADGYSNAIRQDGKRWVGDRSLSVSELLGGGSSYYLSYVAILLVDLSNYAKNLIVTNTTFKALMDAGGYMEFKLNAQGGTDSGLTYPAIPILTDSNRIGHNFRVIVCLTPGMQPSSGNAYAVYSSNITSYIPYSVGFESGCDRTTAQLGSGAFRMDGTTMSAITLTATDMVIERTYQGNVYRAFLISASATFSTANVHYSGTEETIYGWLTLSNSGSFVFGSEPGSGDSSIQISTAVSLAGSTSGQTKRIGSTSNDKYLWVMKYNGTLISTTVNAAVSYTEPFNDPLTSSGSTVIQ